MAAPIVRTPDLGGLTEIFSPRCVGGRLIPATRMAVISEIVTWAPAAPPTDVCALRNLRYYGAFFFAADRFAFLPFWTHTLREGSYTYPSRHIPILRPSVARARISKEDCCEYTKDASYQCNFHAILQRHRAPAAT